MSFLNPVGELVFNLPHLGYVFEVHYQSGKDYFAIKVLPHPDVGDSFWLKEHSETESGCAYLILRYLEQHIGGLK